MARYLRLIFGEIKDKPLSVKNQIQYEMKYLEYINYVNNEINDKLYYVIDFTVYRDKSRPYLLLYHLRSGITLKTKITNGVDFVQNPFQKEDIIEVTKFKEQNKSKKINGLWQKTDEKELVVVDWNVY